MTFPPNIGPMEQDHGACLIGIVSGTMGDHFPVNLHNWALYLLQEQACSLQVLDESLPPLGQQFLALLRAGGLLAGRRLLAVGLAPGTPLLPMTDLPH